MFSRLFSFVQRYFTADRLRVDQPFAWVVIILVAFGLVMLTSASSVVAYSTYSDSYYFLKHQLLSVAIGAAAFWFFSRFDYKHLRKLALFLLIISLALLALVFIPGLGREVNGSRSWITILGFSVQPTEFVKLTFIIYLAALFEKHSETAKRFWSFLILYGILALMVLMQPDVGTLFILTITSFSLYFIGGGKVKHIGSLVAAGAIGLIILMLIPSGLYRLNRFRCLIDVNFDRLGSCYQINQSLIAVGSGGLFGRGLGESRQKFLYLPEVQNDFIFAIIAEETGLLFGLILLLLFIFLFYRGFTIARHAPDTFARNLASGIVIWIVLQAILNIGGIINLLPLTGVPLPLISYGGSAIIAALAGLGIVAGISKQTR